jgi:hypothetical protein
LSGICPDIENDRLGNTLLLQALGDVLHCPNLPARLDCMATHEILAANPDSVQHFKQALPPHLSDHAVFEGNQPSLENSIL